MKKLINKLAHACGLYTADDVEHIEKHWRERLDKVTTAGIKLVAEGSDAGGGEVDMRGAGGKGGFCHGYMPNWYSGTAVPLFIPSTAPQGQTLIINPGKPLDNPSAPTGQLPLHKGALRMTSAERRELAAEAARWCEQQRIETNPENIIFYLDAEKHLIRHG